MNRMRARDELVGFLQQRLMSSVQVHIVLTSNKRDSILFPLIGLAKRETIDLSLNALLETYVFCVIAYLNTL